MNPFKDWGQECIRMRCVPSWGLHSVRKALIHSRRGCRHCAEGDNPGCGAREDLGWPDRRDGRQELSKCSLSK